MDGLIKEKCTVCREHYAIWMWCSAKREVRVVLNSVFPVWQILRVVTPWFVKASEYDDPFEFKNVPALEMLG